MHLGSRFDLIRHDLATGLKLYIVERATTASGEGVVRYLFVGPPALPTTLPDDAIDRASAEQTFDAILAKLRKARWNNQAGAIAAAVAAIRLRSPHNLAPLRRAS